MAAKLQTIKLMHSTLNSVMTLVCTTWVLLKMNSFDSKTPQIDLRKRNQKESVKESIQESKGIGFSSQH